MSAMRSAPTRLRQAIAYAVTLAQTSATLEATIFRYDADGQLFVLTHTTLQTEEGKRP